MSKKKIIIIGAGPGGLSAAMLLASKGFDVEVFEKDSEPGGRNKPLRMDGYTFDTGPTFLLMKFYLDKIFELSGKNVDDYLEFVKLDPMYRLIFKDKKVLISSDPEKMTAEIKRLFPGNEEGYRRFMEKEEKKFWKLYPCLQKDYGSLIRYLHPDFLKAIPYLSLTRNVWSVLGDYFTPDDLRLCFTFQSKYLGMSAWQCPGAFSMVAFAEHKFGIYHVIGGLNRISASMAKASGELGAVIRYKSPVSRLIIEGKTAKGIVTAEGEEIRADAVVVNADFAYAMSELVPEGKLKKYSKANLKKRDYSCSTFMLYLGVDKRYDIPHHNVLFADDYKRNVREIFTEGKLSDDLSFYIQNASVSDKTLAPEGHSTVYVLVPVPNKFLYQGWNDVKEDFRKKVLKQIEEKTEMKDIQGHIVSEKVITPDEWESDYNVYNGATFNLSHKLTQMLSMRPHNRFEELRDLYIVGGGTHPGSGLPTIYESARISAELISKKLGNF